MTTPTPSEALADFQTWFKREYPLYEREGRDTSFKAALRIAWESGLRAGPPEGMMLVPREPTPAMVKAAINAFYDENTKDGMAGVYRAMLAAASSGGKD